LYFLAYSSVDFTGRILTQAMTLGHEHDLAYRVSLREQLLRVSWLGKSLAGHSHCNAHNSLDRGRAFFALILFSLFRLLFQLEQSLV